MPGLQLPMSLPLQPRLVKIKISEGKLMDKSVNTDPILSLTLPEVLVLPNKSTLEYFRPCTLE